MALTREQIIHDWTERKNRIDEMLCDTTVNDKQLFEELCCSVYAGDEYTKTEGIIDNDAEALVELLCDYVITDYATASMLDCQKISFPDHSEIIATICLQLKRDNVLLTYIQGRLKIKDQNNFDWFSSNGNECSQVMSGIKEIWDRA